MSQIIPRIALLSLLAGVTVLIACGDTPTSPMTDATASGEVAEAPSHPMFAVNENDWFTLPWEAEFCGEVLQAELRVHTLGSYTEAASGNLNFKYFVFVHGTAVGLTTGYDYVWNDVWHVEHVTTAPAGFPYTFHYTDNWVIIGKGRAPNFKEKVTIQVTVNANGDATADVLNATTSCK